MGRLTSRMVRLCQKAAWAGATPGVVARLLTDRAANSKPDKTAQSSPWLVLASREKVGVTSSKPQQTRATTSHSARWIRSPNSSASSSTVKAGKLAKPRVATATPEILIATKKLHQ